MSIAIGEMSTAIGGVAMLGFLLATFSAIVNKNPEQGNTDMTHALMMLIAAAICFK